MFKPKLFTMLKDYDRHALSADLFAGAIVGIVAIPLALAFAIASGLPPDRGLLTAIVAGLLISALGGSRVQIGGPTGAFVVIVYGIVQTYGVQGLLWATVLAGFMLIAMGLARFGSVIKFVPHPVVVGFTSGIALVIFSSQVRDFLGLQIPTVPADFLAKWSVFVAHLGETNVYALAIASGTVLLIAFWPKAWRRIPASFFALIISSILVATFQWPVDTIGSRFGGLSLMPKVPEMPALSWQTLQHLIQPAFTIALLGAIESLLSAVVSDGMIGGRHRSNMELIAQGVANIASGLCGGMPATGAIARTVTNIRNGGRTPIAGIVHALTILLIVLFARRWATQIPLACLAGILVVVAYHMSEWRSFTSLLHGPRSGAGVLLVTFALTVLIDLTVAIEVGMVLSAFLFMHEMSQVTRIRSHAHEFEETHPEDDEAIFKAKVPPGVEVFEINGPFFFGVSHQFEETSRIVSHQARVRILRLRHVPFMDATALRSLEQFHEKCQHHGIALILSGLHSQPLKLVRDSGLFDRLGPENVVDDIRSALARAEALHPR